MKRGEWGTENWNGCKTHPPPPTCHLCHILSTRERLKRITRTGGEGARRRLGAGGWGAKKAKSNLTVRLITMQTFV